VGCHDGLTRDLAGKIRSFGLAQLRAYAREDKTLHAVTDQSMNRSSNESILE
jgi:hypothetical protein